MTLHTLKRTPLEYHVCTECEGDGFVWSLAEQIFNAIIAVFNAIPIPDWAQSGADILSSIPPSVGYFVGPFDLGYGAAILGGAYGIRFLIRRIPLIG